MNIVIRGPLLSMSGYGNHAREVFRWVSEKGANVATQILPWGITPWHINPDHLNGMVGKIMQGSISLDPKKAGEFDVSFQIQLPNEWDSSLATYNVGVTAAVETDICNPTWIDSCNKMNLIVVPSHHTKNTLHNSGKISVPVTVVPEAFIDSIAKDTVEPFNLNIKTKFNFLMFGQLTGGNAYVDRKNTFFTLKWLLEEFNGQEDVGVIIKTNNGRNTHIDRQMCSSVISQIKKEINSTVPVYLLHGSMTGDEVASIYRNENVNALVSATRGEGFGLPLLEAAASGLPVLATGWSAHNEFLNHGKWIKFDYDLVDVPNLRIDGQVFVEGSKWAEVKEEDFKQKVRKFYKGPSKPRKWASELSTTLLENYSFNNIKNAWDDVSKEHIGW